MASPLFKNMCALFRKVHYCIVNRLPIDKRHGEWSILSFKDEVQTEAV